jgi:hypothetical protein
MTGNVTRVNKGRAREFTREIIDVEIQNSCRMKNEEQALEYNEKHMTTQSLQQATKQHLTHQFSKQPNLTWNRTRQTIVVEIQPSCRMNMTSKHESKMKNT